jgi:hypothetical protein
VVAITTGIIGIAAAITIIILIRKDHLHVRYGMWWFAVAAVIALIGVFPRIVDVIGVALGIAYPPVLALTVGLVLLVLKILVMDIERSRNQIKLQRLVQRIALLEAELREKQTQASESAPGLPGSPGRDRANEPPVA